MRILSPLTSLFSTMDTTSAAQSSGLPSRLGNGTPSASVSRMSSSSEPSSGVSMIPGRTAPERDVKSPFSDGTTLAVELPDDHFRTCETLFDSFALASG